MQSSPLVLVSCTYCSRLHEPQPLEASNPICTQCAAAATQRPQSPALPRTPSPFGR